VLSQPAILRRCRLPDSPDRTLTPGQRRRPNSFCRVVLTPGYLPGRDHPDQLASGGNWARSAGSAATSESRPSCFGRLAERGWPSRLHLAAATLAAVPRSPAQFPLRWNRARSRCQTRRRPRDCGTEAAVSARREAGMRETGSGGLRPACGWYVSRRRSARRSPNELSSPVRQRSGQPNVVCGLACPGFRRCLRSPCSSRETSESETPAICARSC
jgi:hypothetical protein